MVFHSGSSFLGPAQSLCLWVSDGSWSLGRQNVCFAHALTVCDSHHRYTFDLCLERVVIRALHRRARPYLRVRYPCFEQSSLDAYQN